MPPTTGERFERAVAIMARLRAPGGCPWDREQTFDSIKPYTLEETYEVLEAIDNRDWDELSGELGDLLLQVLFYSEMSKEQGTFTIDDVLDKLSRQAGRIAIRTCLATCRPIPPPKWCELGGDQGRGEEETAGRRRRKIRQSGRRTGIGAGRRFLGHAVVAGGA